MLPGTEPHSVVGAKIMVFFDVVADEAWLAIGRLRCSNEAKAWIAETDAVMTVPSAEHRPTELCWNSAHRCSIENPSRWQVPHP